MSIQDTIQDALEKCVQEGILVERGACFDWVGGKDKKPRAVNWPGAVLWIHRNEIPDYSAKTLGKFLGIDRMWFYRFTIGFDQDRILSVLDPCSSACWVKEIGKDEISSLGRKMCRMFLPKTE